MTYHRLRSEASPSPDAQLEIARWCRKQKLAAEERLHWQLLLMMQPGHPEAMKGLGLRMYDGQMLTKVQIAAAKKETRLIKDTERKWAPTLKRLTLALEQGDPDARQAAVDELEAIRDPRVMALVETTFANQPVAALLVVEMYGRSASQQSTDALVRLALHAKDAAVRQKAAGELRYRKPGTYMPALIGALAAPIELSVRRDSELGALTVKWLDTYTYTGRIIKSGMYGVVRLDGNYKKSDMVYWWGLETKKFSGWLITGYIPDRHLVEYELSSDSPDPETPYVFHGGFETLTRPGGDEPASLARSIVTLEERVREINAQAAELNGRVDAAIREATQAAVAANGQPPKVEKAADVRPRLWWDWWQKQLQLNNYFAKGTEVWTQFGIRPIDEVMVGDRVLTKNLDTGELTFDLVVGIDVKRDSEVRAIDITGRTIVGTANQPLYVPDERWCSAKDLQPGMEIESLAGKLRVETVRSGAAGETYSLLIQGNPNYFVDRQGVLVHDATSN
jgi:hypothetical protein